jgi:hypothetical protein
MCIEGKRNWPPQNNGGWEGYHALTAAMKNRSGRIYDDYISLYKKPYDPEYFNLVETNNRLFNWREYADELERILNSSY